MKYIRNVAQFIQGFAPLSLHTPSQEFLSEALPAASEALPVVPEALRAVSEAL